MNVDMDIDDAESWEFNASQAASQKETVYWMNSQPSPEVREIMRKPRQRQNPKLETTLPSYSLHEVNKVASTLRDPPPGKRPLGRTNSSSRIRPYTYDKSGTNSPALPEASTSRLGCTDQEALLFSMFKDVSVQLEEKMAIRVAEDRTKRKARPSGSRASGSRSRRTTPAPLSGSSYSAKGKERDMDIRGGTKTRATHDRPLLSSSTSSSASSANTSMTDVEITDTSTMDTDPDDILSVHTTQHRYLASDSWGRPASFSEGSSTSNSATRVAAAPRLHPLLVQQQLRRPQQGAANTDSLPTDVVPPQQSQAPQPPPLVQHGPTPSQSSRPPPLGMSRSRSAAAALPQLPTRQKGFKPPTLSQPQPQAHAARVHTSYTPAAPPVGPLPRRERRETQKAPLAVVPKAPEPKARSPSPLVNPEADESFGDISLDVDIDALEETMSKYD